MRPPRLRCTLFPLIYPPHLLVLPATFGLHLLLQTYPYFRASYVISVRRTKSLPTASFRFHLTMGTLAVRLYTSSLPRRVRDFHPLERAHGAQTKSRTFFMSCLICILILLVPRMEQSEVNRRLQCLLMVLIILSKIQCLKIFSLQKIKPSSMWIIIFNMKAASFFIISSENRGYNLESPNFSPPSFFSGRRLLGCFFCC